VGRENRTWPTRYRGPVLVHASKQPDDTDEIEFRFGARLPSDLLLGGIVGIGNRRLHAIAAEQMVFP
jgi:hypothetical protein